MILHQDIELAMAELTAQQQEVITLRFGLNSGQPMTLAKIGEHLNVSRERVRQIEREALNKLRKRKMGVRGYLAS
jgi:RNA polymerase nonessential primary-like sigma factor